MTKLYFLDVPLHELKRRIAERNKSLSPDTFHVDPDDLDLWAKGFEPPTEEELS